MARTASGVADAFLPPPPPCLPWRGQDDDIDPEIKQQTEEAAQIAVDGPPKGLSAGGVIIIALLCTLIAMGGGFAGWYALGAMRARSEREGYLAMGEAGSGGDYEAPSTW